MRRLESVQGRLIKQSLGLSKLSHNTALLKGELKHSCNIPYT